MFSRIKRSIKADELYFSACEASITERNDKMLIKGSVLYALVLAFYTVLTVITRQPQVLRTMYYVFDAIHICLCVALFVRSKQGIKSRVTTSIFCACLEISVLSFFALEGVFVTPTEHALYIPIAILLVLLIFTHRVVYAHILTFFYVTSFAVLSYLYKTPEAYINDLYIAIATLISADIGYAMIAQIRHSEGNALVKYERLSQTDQLTGIYNKASIMNICDQIMQDKDRACPFIVFDLDDFKKINDQYGHDVGDEVLKAVSRQTELSFRGTDFVGRFGGDEFIVLMDKCKDVEIVKFRVEQLLKSISELTFLKEDMRVQCSAGIALKRENDTTQAIFKRADTALYQAKEEGKGQYRLIE